MYILGSVSLVFSLDTLQQHQPTQFWLFPFFFFLAGLIPRPPSLLIIRPPASFDFLPSSCIRRFGSSYFVCLRLLDTHFLRMLREYIAEINIYTDSCLNVCTCYFRWCHLGCWISWRVLMGMMRKIERIKTSDLWYGGEIRWKNRQGNWAIHVFLFFLGGGNSRL